MATTKWDTGLSSARIAFPSADDLTATMNTSFYAAAIGSIAKSTGKRYFELNAVSVHNFSGQGGVGITDQTYPNTTPLNQTAHFEASLAHDTNIYVNGVTTGTTMVDPTGHTVGVAVDIDAGEIWFQIDGAGNWNAGGTANPATGVGGISFGTGHSITPFAFLVWSISDGDASNDTATLNLTGDFVGTVPSGFTAWDPVPYLDGKANSGTTFHSSASGSVTLTTKLPGDAIILEIVTESATANVTGIASTNTTGWARRGTRQSYGAGRNVNMEVWYGFAAAPLSAEVITVTLDTGIDGGSIEAFGVHSDAGTYSANPFDTNGSLPAFASHQDLSTFVNTTPQVSGVSTDDTDPLVLAFYGTTAGSGPTVGSLFRQDDSNFNAFGVHNVWSGFEHRAPGAALAATTEGFSNSTFDWGVIADAIVNPVPALNLTAFFTEDSAMVATIALEFALTAFFAEDSAMVADVQFTYSISADFTDGALMATAEEIIPPPPPIQSPVIIIGR